MVSGPRRPPPTFDLGSDWINVESIGHGLILALAPQSWPQFHGAVTLFADSVGGLDRAPQLRRSARLAASC